MKLSRSIERRIDRDDRHGDECFENRFDGDFGAVLNFRGDNSPNVTDCFAAEESLDFVRLAGDEEMRFAEGAMLVSFEFEFVITFLEIFEGVLAVGVGEAFGDDLKSDGVADGDVRAGDFGRAIGEESVFIDRGDEEVTFGFGERAESEWDRELGVGGIERDGAVVISEREIGGRSELKRDFVGGARARAEAMGTE